MRHTDKNKLYTVIQLNWKRNIKEFINPPKGNCSVRTIIVHYIVDRRHMNFFLFFKLGGIESHVFIWLQRGI